MIKEGKALAALVHKSASAMDEKKKKIGRK